MSSTTIRAEFKVEGVLTNATTAKLSDATGTYGVKRTDTNAVVVADGTNLTAGSTGVYTYSFTDPAPDLTYTYALEFVYGGETYRSSGNLTGGTTLSEPITLTEVKQHLRIDDTDSDNILAVYIKAARTTAEAVTNRAFLTRTVTTYFDEFCDTMELPYPPLSSVTSIAYLDEDGVSQTLSASVYRVVTGDTVGRIELAYDQSWPATYPITNAVTVTHVSGYGSSASSVPEHFRLAMLHMVARWFENREPVVIGVSANELDNVEMSLLGLDRMIPV